MVWCSTVSIISHTTFSKLNDAPHLLDWTEHPVTTATGEALQVIGHVDLTVNLAAWQGMVQLIVVMDFPHSALLGMDAIRAIKSSLNSETIHCLLETTLEFL